MKPERPRILLHLYRFKACHFQARPKSIRVDRHERIADVDYSHE
jgi:hypothetical protein